MLFVENETRPRVLVSMPCLRGSFFERSVVLLCQYSAAGALALVINSPSRTTIHDLMLDLKIQCPNPQHQPIMVGGPVQPDLSWVLHSSEYKKISTVQISANLSFSSGQDFLNNCACNDTPLEYTFGVGYAQWGSGQLDREIEQEAWWLANIDPMPLLRTAYQDRWDFAMRLIGLNKCSRLHFYKA